MVKDLFGPAVNLNIRRQPAKLNGAKKTTFICPRDNGESFSQVRKGESAYAKPGPISAGP